MPLAIAEYAQAATKFVVGNACDLLFVRYIKLRARGFFTASTFDMSGLAEAAHWNEGLCVMRSVSVALSHAT